MPRRIIPKRVVLPFGFIVYVRRISPREIRKRMGNDANDPHTAETSYAGFWDADRKTIFIDNTLPVLRQRYILAHELLHAVHDWAHLCLNDGVTEPL